MVAILRAVRRVPLVVLVMLLGAGCAGGGGGDASSAAAAREKAKAGWLLKVEGSPGTLALESMDVYLMEDETAPEMFDLHGEGVRLVGTIPPAAHVGFGAEFGKLVGQTLSIQASGGDPDDPGTSSITLDGVEYPVAGGTFRVEKLTGKWDGSEGDKTLHGTVELRVLESGGERSVRGTLATHVVTWG